MSTSSWINCILCVLIFCLYFFISVKCSIHEFPSSCPDTTICEQIPEKDTGECECRPEFEFNERFNGVGKSDYCIPLPNYSRYNHNEPAKEQADAKTDASSLTPTTNTTVKQRASSHHIISGILISILIVTAFILTVIAVKKLRIRQRFRDFGISQRNRPLYEDVMMGNDDDPPLI